MTVKAVLRVMNLAEWMAQEGDTPSREPSKELPREIQILNAASGLGGSRGKA